MKYNLESLEYALDYLLPEIKEAKEEGVYFDRLDLIKSVAGDYLVYRELTEGYNPDFKSRMCIYVVAEALKDLKTLGYFQFGERNLKDEV